MAGPLHSELSRRESQIMDILYQLSEATASQIQERLPDTPSNSAVRTLLSILEAKGVLSHRRDGKRFIYHPTATPEKAKRSALNHLLKTFFNDSASQVVTTLLSTANLSNDDLDELASLIEQAKQEGS